MKYVKQFYVIFEFHNKYFNLNGWISKKKKSIKETSEVSKFAKLRITVVSGKEKTHSQKVLNTCILLKKKSSS